MEFNDKCFMFFWNLPIPIPCLKNDLSLTSHVYANKSTSEVIHYLRSIDPNIAYACYPQYGVPGFGCHHRVLCSKLNPVNFLQARKEMWETLGLLRLVKPLPIHIAGTVEIRDNDISGFETLWHKTHLNINHRYFSGQALDYSEEDILLVQINHETFTGFTSL